MISEASASHSVHGGRGVPSLAGGGVLSEGRCHLQQAGWGREQHPHPRMAEDAPIPKMAEDGTPLMVNKWAVCILLECFLILLVQLFSYLTRKHSSRRHQMSLAGGGGLAPVACPCMGERGDPCAGDQAGGVPVQSGGGGGFGLVVWRGPMHHE